ncbi:MAG: hypothetical protein PHG35_02050 [Dehalococcoidales bacterium]|nr:hypothetical protein [Dehalococcoidales bacterium]
MQKKQYLNDLREYDGQRHPIKVILPDGRVIYQDDVPFEDIPYEQLDRRQLFKRGVLIKGKKQ